MRTTLLTTALALVVGPLSGSAAVTVEAWFHLGEVTDIYADSSANSRRLGLAFSTCNGGGNSGALVTANGAGGPLGGSGFTSTKCLQFGFNNCQGAMWGAGATGGDNTGWNPPAANYGIEVWALPMGNGYNGGSPTFIFSSGRGGGVAICLRNTGEVYASIIGGPTVGDPVPANVNGWTHFAIVNDNGVTTFYVNGTASGASDEGNATVSAGDVHIGAAPFVNNAFEGLIDEARIFTFAAGQFSTNDFLLRPPGPSIIDQPESATVWDGGAVPFTVNASLDAAIEYQWRRGAVDLDGEINASLFLPLVGAADSGSQFTCVLTKDSVSSTSAVAKLTIVPQKTADAAYYRAAVTAEPTLAAFFPVDGCVDATVINTVDVNFSGALELNATYDGRTNRAFGERALAFNGDGDVQIPNSAAFEFGSEGTLEGLVFLSRVTADNPTIFAWAQDSGTLGYAFQVSRDGAMLVYRNDSPVSLSWPVPVNLVGRLAHVALVFSDTTNVTAYVDGQSLGTKAQPGFGAASGAPAWIGALGSQSANRWAGTIDELAIYSSALSLNKIQVHYSRFVYGTNVSPPSVVRQPGSKTLLAGAAPILAVQTAGTLPISYQWTSNGVAIAGATTPILALTHTTTNASASYVLWLTNAIGWAKSEPIDLVFVAPTGVYAEAVLQDGPSSYWRLGESSGTLAEDSAGLNDAAYVGALTLGASGAVPDANAAVNFTGGHAEAPNSASLNPSGAFTVEFWAKPSQPGLIGRCVIGSQNRAIGRSGYAVYQGLNYNCWESHIGDGNTVQIWLFSLTQPVADVWYHVAVVYSGTNTGRIYVNGKDDTDTATSTLAGPYLPNSAAPFEIASRYGGAIPYPGVVDEVAFYNYALTEEQLLRHYKVGSPIKLAIAPAAGLVADSKPLGTPHLAVNSGAAWAATNDDGAQSRTGVMQFVGAEDDQITLGAAPAFVGPAGTLSFWMRSAGTSGPGSTGAMLVDWRTTAGLVLVQGDDGKLFVQTVPTGANTFSSSASVSDDLWHHVALVYDQTPGTGFVYLYIDGISDSGQPNASAWSWPAAQRLELGRSHDSYWKKYTGFLDDVRLYNRALEEYDVAGVMIGEVVDDSALQVRLDFTTAPKSGLKLSWSPAGTLESCATVKGTYQEVPDVVSPVYFIPTQPVQFFRCRE
jgi:hypothetical protein